MKKWFMHLVFGLATAASYGAVVAQGSNSGAATPATTQPAAAAASEQAPPTQRLPAVESVDILNQNQAERTQYQPGNLAPTYRIIKEGTENYSSLPYLEAGVLIQPKAQFLGQARATTAGEAWRQYRNGPLTLFGGWLLILAVVGIAGIYLVKGKVRLKHPRTGRLIERFTSVERIVHWTVAISFLTLAFTGLLMLFGKHVILPLFGHTLFGWLTYAGKNIHNFVGPIFTGSIVVFFVIYVRDNLPQAADWKWLRRVGGLVGKEHVSAGRFNAGEKLWFWGGMVVLGLIVSASGFVLNMLVPGIDYTRGNMQLANVVHIVAAVLVFAISLGHIYIGTIGIEGAYGAMRTGYVDDTWAQEHHDLWYQDIQDGKVPRVRTEEGAAKVGAPAKVG